MAYKYITKYNSPNYTPKSQTKAVWGVNRDIKYICIHWWGDPKQGPTFSGVVNYLCRRGGNTSAHLVATGTGRQVACLVNFFDNAWACMSGNPYTINIELDPRCRDEDYDVAAEVIADLRQHYGNLPLKPHKYWVSTSCPGKYDLAKLDRLAKTKVANDTMGQVRNKVTKPRATHKVVPDPVKLPEVLHFTAELDKTNVWDLNTNPNYKAATTLNKGDRFDAYAKVNFNGSTYYVTKWSFDHHTKYGVNAVDLVPVPPKEKPVEPKPPVDDQQVHEDPAVAQEALDQAKANNALLKQLVELIGQVLSKLTSIFK